MLARQTGLRHRRRRLRANAGADEQRDREMVDLSRWIKRLTLGLALGAAASPALAINSLEGVIYDSRTRAPIQGAQITLWSEVAGFQTQLPRHCLAPEYDNETPEQLASPYVQTTGADGAYVLRLTRGQPACPEEDDTLKLLIRIDHPNYMRSVLAPSRNPDYDWISRSDSLGDYDVAGSAAPPQTGDWPSYWLAWMDQKLAPRIFNHHIPLDIRTPDLATITGQVTDAVTGAPIPGGRVTVQGPNGALPAVCTPGGGSVVTGADARYAFSLDLGVHENCPVGVVYTVAAEPPSGSVIYPSGGSNQSDPLSPGDDDVVNVRIPPLPQIALSGVVRSALDGALIPGARVTVQGPSGPIANACFVAGGSSQTVGADAAYLVRIALNADASCPNRGVYAASVLPPEGSTAYTGADSQSRTLNSTAGDVTGVDLYLDPVPVVLPQAQLSGVVTNSRTGALIPGARVTVQGPSGPIDAACVVAGQTNWTVGPDAAYVLRLALGAHASCPVGGTYAAAVAAPAGSTNYANPTNGSAVLAADESRVVNLTLTPVIAAISGVVTDSSTGSPVPGAVVTIQGPNGPISNACFLEGGSPQTLGANGAYAALIALGTDASCPVGGTYTSTAQPPAGSDYEGPVSGSTPLSGDDDRSVNLTLTPRPVGPTIINFSGVVTDSATGAPIPGAIVTLRGPSGALDESCLANERDPRTNRRDVQTAGANGGYAMRLILGAHASCPNGGRYEATVQPPVDSEYAGSDLAVRTVIDTQGDVADANLQLALAVIDLRVKKTASTSNVAPGDSLTYTLTVTNTGRALEEIYVEDRASPWLTYLDGSATVEIGRTQHPAPILSVPPGQPLRFGPFAMAENATLIIRYAMRVSRTAPAVEAHNTAVIYRNGVEVSSDRAVVAISAYGNPFENSLVYGKVFYDCNANGWQDQPKASGVTLFGGFAPGVVRAGSVTVDRGFGPEPFAGDLSQGLNLGDLDAAPVGSGAQTGRLVVRATLNRPEAAPLRLVTAQGFDATLAPNGELVRSGGPMAADACGDLRMMRAVTPASDGSQTLTIVIVSGCRAETGVAGARLATVEGLLIETDSYGRYHIADAGEGHWRRGSNMLVKLDPASLPMGAQVLSTNPQRLRLTGGPMQAANFGVSCPAPQGFYAEQIAEIGAVCFLENSAALDPAQSGALVAAAEHLLIQGGGEVLVECRPCEGRVDAALNAGRVAAVQTALAGMLPPEVMRNVSVRSEAPGIGFSPIPPQGSPMGFPGSFPAPDAGPVFMAPPAHQPAGVVPGGVLSLPPSGAPLPAPAPEAPPSKGLFKMIFGSNEAEGEAPSRFVAGPFRAAALAGALLGAGEAHADAPGAGKAVSAPLSRGVAATPVPQFAVPQYVGPMAPLPSPQPFCATLGRPTMINEACPSPITERYCPDTGAVVPLGADCPVPRPVQIAAPPPPPPPPPVVEPPKPAFAVKPREICPEAKCGDVLVRSLVELPFGASLAANADAQSADPRLDAIAPRGALLAEGGFAAPVVFQSFSNYGKFIDRWEVAIFRDTDKNLSRPIAVLPGARLGDPIAWSGDSVDGRGFKPGETLRYVVRAYDAEGRRDETKPRQLLLTADPGHMILKGEPHSAYGRDSLARQSIPLMGGRVTVRGAHVPPGWRVAVAGEEIPVDQNGAFAWESLRTPGLHEIPVELASPDGVVWNRLVAADVPASSFFMVGLADVTVGEDYVSKALERAGGADDFDQDIFANGRLAFYLKGKIQGRYLITAHADTHENELKHLFDDFVDYRNPQSVFRRLDPDRYYPVYGDGSVSRADVDTQGKFYVRIEDGDYAHALWGNYNTGFTGTELARYERSLYGARGEFNSRAANSYGESYVHVKGFASQPHTAAAHNEFIGTGGSLYYLRQRDIVVGSEKLRVEVRDRDSGRVLESTALVPGKDYAVNAIQGRVLLTNPLRSYAGRSGTNVVSTGPTGDDLVFLVADYEYVPDVGDGDSWTYGGRALAWLGDHFSLGGTYVEERQEDANDYELIGADAALRWRPGTYLRAEWARSRAAEGAQTMLSDNGGMTFYGLSSSLGRPVEGDAISVEGRVDLQEVFSTTWGGEIQAWWKRRDDAFSNVQTTLDRFRESFGGSVELRPTDSTRVAGRVFIGEHETGYDERVISGQIDQSFGRTTLSLESRYEEEIHRGSTDLSGLIVGGKLAYAVKDGAEIYVRAQTSFMEEGDFVDATGGAVGFSARLSDKLTAHGEFAHYTKRGDGATFGLEYQRSPDHRVYGAYTHSTDRDDERRHAFTLGQRAEVTSGLDVYHENLFGVRRDGGSESSQTYGVEISPRDDLSLGLSYQRADLDTYGGDLQRDAISASARWKAAQVELSGKAEWRRDRGEGEELDQWLASVRAKAEITPSTTALAKVTASYTDNLDDPARDARFWEASVGLAYRPVEHDNFNMLAKYTYLYDLPAPEQTPNGTDQKAHLVSVEGEYRVTPRLSFGAKGAYKHGEVREDRNAGGWAKSRLSYGAANARVRIFDNWDAMAEYRLLHDLESDSTRHGAMVAVYRRFGDHFELGAGYNFAAFGDDLFDTDLNGHGWFINAVGKF